MKSNNYRFAKRLKGLASALGMLSGLALASSAYSEGIGQEIYETHCVECHGSDGRGTVDGELPRLNGQHAVVVVKQILDIRALNRSIPEMEPYAMPDITGDEDDLFSLGQYIASFPQDGVENGKGAGDNLELGARLYVENCSQCHGANGEGSYTFAVPRVGGQHYEYMYRQFQKVRFGQRFNMIQAMRELILNFTEEERKAVLDYTSRLSGKVVEDTASGDGSQSL